MALIIRGQTACALCREAIAPDDDLIGTPHFIESSKDSFWHYSDAAFHKRCFLAWERRDEFVRRFNEAAKPFVFGNGKRNHMQDDGSIIQVEP